jgi:hypothetical protein
MDCGPHPKDGVRPFLASFPPAQMPDPAVVRVENMTMKGPDGQDDLGLLVLRPAASDAPPEGFPVVRSKQ